LTFGVAYGIIWLKIFTEDKFVDEESKEERTTGSISADLIRGHINTIILRTLYERDKYGYEIIEEIETKSHGQYTLKQPTLYSALKRLESQGYITAYWKTDEVSAGGRRKYYTLTESGREITEKNQAEWEYSRTVIDNLISDKNFDFTQAPPTPVDFKILKNSTSRVPIVKIDTEEKEEKENTAEKVELASDEKPAESKTEEQPLTENKSEEKTESVNEEGENSETGTAKTETHAVEQTPNEEERKRIHENYLKLISEPLEKAPEEPQQAPYSDSIDTEKLIYNNRPEPERDYKNLINGLFDRTVKPVHETAPSETSEKKSPSPALSSVKVNYEDFGAKAEKDGLTVNTSESSGSTFRNKTYNRGNTLLKCSLIIGVLMLLEFALSLIFKDELKVGVGYPLVILFTGIAQVLVFLVLKYTDFGKTTRKPASLSYLWSSIIFAIILMLIILIVAFLLQINFYEVGDIMAKLIIPCVITLNIPLFSLIFYLLSNK